MKTGAEMSFLYGNNVNKAGLARITDGIPQYGGVVVFSMSDIPLGFGVAAQPTEYCKDLEPMANVVRLDRCGGYSISIADIYYSCRSCIKVTLGSTLELKMACFLRIASSFLLVG